MDRIAAIAAYLRGLNFDGEKGCIVSYSADVTRAVQQERWTPLPPLPEAPSESGALGGKLEHFLKTHCRADSLPQGFILEGEGRFALAHSYDGAQALLGEHSEPSSAPSSSPEPASASASESSPASSWGIPSMMDKVALVTGGAQGFGEGIVRHLVEAGAYCYIADLNIDGARSLAEELNGKMGSTRAFALQINVTNEASVEAAVDEAGRLTGGFDIFISNAGVLKAGSVKEMSLDDFRFVTDVDYSGFFICTKFAARLLAIQNRPTGCYYSDIIGMSSKSGLEGSRKNGAYAGAKFGISGLAQSFALELVEDNIKVNVICPGNFLDGPLWSDPEKGLFVQYLKTGKVPGASTVEDVRKSYEEKVPMGRGCTPTDVAKAIFYVVDQKYETGQALPVTGGQVMLH